MPGLSLPRLFLFTSGSSQEKAYSWERDQDVALEYQCTVYDTLHMHSTLKMSLKRHSLVNKNLAEFSCKVCNKKMKRKTSLEEHMRTHMG